MTQKAEVNVDLVGKIIVYKYKNYHGIQSDWQSRKGRVLKYSIDGQSIMLANPETKTVEETLQDHCRWLTWLNLKDIEVELKDEKS
jgi:hypothetical protein